MKFKYVLPILLMLLVFACASDPEESPMEPETGDTEQIATDDVPESDTQDETSNQETTQDDSVVDQLKDNSDEIIVVDPEPEEETTEVDQSEEEVTPEYVPEPLDETLINDAKKEIFKAEEARAQIYFSDRLRALKDKLTKAIALKESDPDQARLLLAEIFEEAELLTQDSLIALKDACVGILKDKTMQLLKLDADKYTPEEYEITQTQREEAVAAFEANDFTLSLALYRTAYTSLTNLYNSLSENMYYIETLKKLINSKKYEADQSGVYEWAPNEYNLAVASWERSVKLLYTDYNAVEGELALRETLFYARKAISQAEINREVAELDAELRALMGEIEEASTLTVLDSEDNIISPEEWNETLELKDRPIEAQVETEEESGLKPVDLEDEVEVEFPELSLKKIEFISGDTRVLGMRDERKNMLEQAKEYWKLGVDARNNGNLQEAREYLAKTKIYIDEYKSMAVDYIYTVILNPELRDCLWRISEKEEYYGDPLLWQNIWERNKKLIQDPDLIYPGWKLIIPPIEEEINFME